MGRISGKHVGNKQKKGGQSQNRIQRLRDERENYYITNIIEKATSIYFEDGDPVVKGIIMLGSGSKKDMVMKKMEPRLRKLVLGIITISGSETLYDIVNLAEDMFEQKQEESPWIERFLEDITLGKGLAVYGPDQINRSLENGLLEVLIVRKGAVKTWAERAENVGCTVIESNRHALSAYGEAVGMSWYVLGF